MSQVWSEINKVVNVLPAKAHGASTSNDTDIVNMKDYNKCTFIVETGVAAANTPIITVLSGVSNASAATATAFKYRTQVKAADSASSSGDIPSALTDATATGFVMTTNKGGGIYIIEVDAATVAAAGTGYDHVCLHLSTGAAAAANLYSVLAILSEPRYPQGILATAIE